MLSIFRFTVKCMIVVLINSGVYTAIAQDTYVDGTIIVQLDGDIAADKFEATVQESLADINAVSNMLSYEYLFPRLKDDFIQNPFSISENKKNLSRYIKIIVQNDVDLITACNAYRNSTHIQYASLDRISQPTDEPDDTFFKSDPTQYNGVFKHDWLIPGGSQLYPNNIKIYDGSGPVSYMQQ